MNTKRTFGVALALAVSLPLIGHAQETDPDSGFVIDDGWQVVNANCTACHSAKLVTQNSGSRQHWKGLIRWMQNTQGLWQFQPEMENTILDYLAKHYGPKDDARRPPLTRDQLPDNPYKQADKTSG